VPGGVRAGQGYSYQRDAHPLARVLILPALFDYHALMYEDARHPRN
jgi:hypothetical protein